MASVDTSIGAKPQGSTVPYRGSTVPSATDVQGAIDAIYAYLSAADLFVHTANVNLPAALVATNSTEISWDFSTANVVKAALASHGVGMSKIVQGSALSVLGVTGNATADHADIAGTADQVLRVNTAGTALAFGTIATAGVTDAAITYAKIQDVAGLSVVGRSASTSGVSAAITGADGNVLRVSGTTLGFGSIATAGITDAAVTYAKIQNVAGLSVVGRSANSSGVAADITGTDGQALRVSGTALGFGSLATAGITDAAVTYAKIQNVAGLSVFGRSANSSGVGADITGADGNVLRVSGTTLGFGSIATAGITDAAVTYAKIQNVAGLSVLGRSANSSGVGADITGTDKQILRVSGTTLGFGTIDLSSTSAVANQLAAASMPALTGSTASAGGTLSTTSTIDLFITIGDGTNVISTGVGANWFTLDFAGTFVQWSILAAQSGSISIDLWKTTYSSFDAGATHPVAGDKISASAPITFSSATKGQSSTLTGWTTTFSAGDILAFNVSSVTTCKQVTICFKVTKTS